MSNKIQVLDKLTIDKIAAGEVVERPLSVVKELVENAMDAHSSSITVEIKDGGISYIRITDNGSGIPGDELQTAFLRHSTSKITSAQDLNNIQTLGFRGEALSSISAVSQMEVITKTANDFIGNRLNIEGGVFSPVSPIGAPDGTTMIVKNLFYNTPARKKFLKTPQTEGSYISAIMEHLALSHPEIAFRFIVNGQTKLQTAGNGRLEDTIYRIFGREVMNDLLPIFIQNSKLQLTGFIAKPSLSRGNRNYENFYVNGRYVKCNILCKAVEEGYKSFIMQHKFPFVVLYFTLPEGSIDVNVHPTKMEIRFEDEAFLFDTLVKEIRSCLANKELISASNSIDDKEAQIEHKELLKSTEKPEPFEALKLNKLRAFVRESSPYEVKYDRPIQPVRSHNINNETPVSKEITTQKEITVQKELTNVQETLFNSEQRLLDISNKKHHKIIGQVFDTYWLVEFAESLYIIDQHAAHERILYEKIIKQLETREMASQQLSPPLIISLTDMEWDLLHKYEDQFTKIGFTFESFGGKDISITSVPYNMYGIKDKQLFIGMLDELNDFSGKEPPSIITEKIAMMSCKAAVKGNQSLSHAEAQSIIDQLMELENPYHCPHGRPTIIEMKKSEMERRFHR